ncbi:C-type lectin domain family 4 member M isoform X4 [Gadus chalcogrammus]|uniref:C-type lectin domain family 4 member M isoform X4 n=1 Tax=Gadus chalcogrammus TaxID=1042646 RepID=UPI0024C4A917|nr:C-type lectin domain family 4 member M isoform X4 [Gadus chalcogrammus]
MAKETIGRGMEEEVPYTSVVFYSNTSASKGLDIRRQEADTVYEEVKVQNGALEQTTPAVFKGNHELVSQLQELKENQTTLLAYQDHLEAVVGNLTSSNENLVRSHSNQSRSCDVFINENQDLKTELTELKEANRLTDTCAQKTIDTYCRTKQGQSPMCRPCETGWVNGNSSCSVIVDDDVEGKTWAEAREDCRGRRADLVVIDNEEEQNLVTYNSSSSTSDIKGYWLGLSDTAGNGTWSWVDGTNVTLKLWTSTNDTTSSPRCAVTRETGWSGVNCTAKNHWICEKKRLSV